MAIINLTPDSFYDASRHTSIEEVRADVERAVCAGATIIDLGGYSSRPGAEDVSIEEEWRRVRMGLDVVRDMKHSIAVSIDTFRSDIVSRAVKEYGEVIVNDISAGELDCKMIDVVAEIGTPYVAMHMRGVPQSMQSMTDYECGVVSGVKEYFVQRVETLCERGIEHSNIVLDPGFGFAKSPMQSLELLAHIEELRDFGCPILVGVSRKSMIYRTLNITPQQALPGSLALGWEALRRGASILRVHDVAETRQIVDLYNSFKTYTR